MFSSFIIFFDITVLVIPFINISFRIFPSFSFFSCSLSASSSSAVYTTFHAHSILLFRTVVLSVVTSSAPSASFSTIFIVAAVPSAMLCVFAHRVTSSPDKGFGDWFAVLFPCKAAYAFAKVFSCRFFFLFLRLFFLLFFIQNLYRIKV